MKKLMEHIDSLILNWGVEDGKLSSLEELYGVLIDKGWDHPSATAYLNNIHKVFLGEAPEDDTKPLTDKDKEILKQSRKIENILNSIEYFEINEDKQTFNSPVKKAKNKNDRKA